MSKAAEILRSIFSFPVFLGAVLAGAAFYYANRGVADPDIWWHLRNAEYVVNTHHFVRFDMYSYTVRGTAWLDHEWLSEIAYYFGWKVGGLRGVFVVMLILIEAILLGIYALATQLSGNSKASFLSTCIAMLLATVSFGPRMLLFGWLYLIVMISVLWSYKEARRDHLWILPPLFCLWINSHGSWLIGIAVLAIFIVSGLTESSWGIIEARRWSSQRLRKLLLVSAACFAALFVNPYGYRLVFYPFDLAFKQKLNLNNVEEWASVDFHSVRGKILLATILLTLILALSRKLKLKLEETLLFVLAVYASVTYLRFLFLAGIILAPILARRLDMLPPYRRDQDKPILNAILIAAVIAFMVWKFPTPRSLEDDIAMQYPVKAGAQLREFVHQNPGTVLNEYAWGGYLIWYCPEIPVYVDSRFDIFEHNGVMQDYMELATIRNSYQVLDKTGARYLLLATHGPLSYMLRHNPGWKLKYSDEVGAIFERVPDSGNLALGRK